MRRYGGYNQALVDEAAAISDGDERRAVLRGHVKANLLEPPWRQTAGFFAAKTAWVWATGPSGPPARASTASVQPLHHDGILGDVSD